LTDAAVIRWPSGCSPAARTITLLLAIRHLTLTARMDYKLHAGHEGGLGGSCLERGGFAGHCVEAVD